MKQCEVHPKFLELKSTKTKANTVKCGECKIPLLIRRKDKFIMGDLPPVKIKFEISKHDLKHNIKDGTWNGYPDEYYSTKNLKLFKHGNTVQIEKPYTGSMSLEEFTPLWFALLKQHEGDESMQHYFLRNSVDRLELRDLK